MPQKFDLSLFTQRARNALERAQELAGKFQHKHVDVEHVLLGLLEQEDGVARAMLERMDIDHRPLGRKLFDELELLPRSYRTGREVFVAKALLSALQEARRVAKEEGDQFSSSEHLLYAFAKEEHSYGGKLLKEAGATPEALRRAMRKVSAGRGGAAKSGGVAETDVLHQYAMDLTGMAERDELDPIIGRDDEIRRVIQVLTSNVGSRQIMELSGQVSDQELAEEIELILRDHFRPEFLNCLDAPIAFSALSKENIRMVVDIQKRRLVKMLAGQRMTIDLTEASKDFLTEAGYEPEYGAPPLRRSIATYIQDPLSVEMLEGKFEPGDHVVVDVSDDGEFLPFTKGTAAAEPHQVEF